MTPVEVIVGVVALVGWIALVEWARPERRPKERPMPDPAGLHTAVRIQLAAWEATQRIYAEAARRAGAPADLEEHES